MYIQEKSVNIVYQQICCITFRETSSGPVFGNEIEKKRFLDMLLNAIREFKVSVYAYCVLDHEAYVLAAAESRKEIQKAAQETKRQFIAHCRRRFPGDAREMQTEFEWLKGCNTEQLIQIGIAFHLLPVRQRYVEMPEDYWWSSMKEYELRYQSGIIKPERCMERMAGSRKQMLRKIKALHRHAQPQGEKLCKSISL